MWIYCAYCERDGAEGDGLFCVGDGQPRECPDCAREIGEGVAMSPLSPGLCQRADDEVETA